MRKGKKHRSRTANIFNKIIEKNFLNLKKEMHIKVQEAYRSPNKWVQKRDYPQHIIIKKLKVQNKERVLKAERKKKKTK